jgi:hypothetical protein
VRASGSIDVDILLFVMVDIMFCEPESLQARVWRERLEDGGIGVAASSTRGTTMLVCGGCEDDGVAGLRTEESCRVDTADKGTVAATTCREEAGVCRLSSNRLPAILVVALALALVSLVSARAGYLCTFQPAPIKSHSTSRFCRLVA